jgi:hypothetical protein
MLRILVVSLFVDPVRGADPRHYKPAFKLIDANNNEAVAIKRRDAVALLPRANQFVLPL